MSEYVLRTRNLCKSYAGKFAVDHVNMEIKKGQIYGFIGKNGAGKTTLMRMVCDLASPTQGELELFGSSDPASLLAARRKMGSMIENPALFPQMTAYENMEVQGKLIGVKDKELIQSTLAFVGLADTAKKKTKNFSLGMKQRLAMAVALLNRPDFLVLDEPINGMDPSGIAEVRELLKKLVSEKNTAILISSHILSELHLLATHYGIIDNGKLIKQLSAEDLNNECRQFIELIADDIPLTETILKDKLGITNYNRMPNHTIQIYDGDFDTLQINKTLMDNGIILRSLSVKGQDLEAYFLGSIA